jgi:uncharacterized protein YndB with AHSA1/START domain
LSKPSLTIVRRMKASPAKVFAALTRPEMLVQWWGPDPTPPLHAEADLRVGGRYRVQFSTIDGQRHETYGVYREIQPNRRLAFTFQWLTFPDRDTLVTIDLAPTADGTEVTILHEHFVDEPVRDDHDRGWRGALDRLETLLERTADAHA